VRQIHRQEMDLALNTADYPKRFTKIHLGMAWWMEQRHKHLALTLPDRKDVVLYNRDAASEPVLITQSFKNPLRRMPLLLVNLFIRLKSDPKK